MDIKDEPGATAYVCDVCGKAIANKCNLKRHKLMHTGFNESVKCGICQKTLSSEGNLKRHMRMHNGSQERQSCNTCGKSFSNVGNLRRHLRTHQTPGVIYECKLCNKCFPFEDYLKKHVRTVHLGGDLKRKSESSTLPHIESFIKREDEHNEENSEQEGSQTMSGGTTDNDEKVVCNSTTPSEELLPSCDEKPTMITEIKTEHHSTESPIHQSNTQESETAPSDSLTPTEIQEAEGAEQNVRDKLCPTDECSICKQVLADPDQVKLDVWRMHLDMRSVKKDKSEKYSFEYNCTVCGKFLSNKGNLKRHMLLLHKKDLSGCDVDTNIEQMRAECNICGRMVANRGNLKRHIEKVHLKRLAANSLDTIESTLNATATEEAKSQVLQESQLSSAVQSEIKEEPVNSEDVEPPLKKRREVKENSVTVVCSSEECSDPKPSLKVRIKTTPLIPNTVPIPIETKEQTEICMDQTTICNDPTCPEYKKQQAQEAQEQAQANMMNISMGNSRETDDRKDQTESLVGDNSDDIKGSSRWRSRSFDESYAPQQPNSSMKDGVCPPQCGENHSCPTCKRRFLCEENFKKHMKRHRSCKLPKPLDTRMTLEGINEVAPNNPMCHLCGQIMPFPVSLQHHLQVVHGTGPTAPPLFPTTTSYPKPPTDFVNWSYPPILTRFAKRETGTSDGNCESVLTGPVGSVDVQSVLTSRCHESQGQGSPTTAFSAPTTPLRKYISDQQPTSECTSPDGNSPINVGHCSECVSLKQKDEKPVLVIMQPRCA